MHRRRLPTLLDVALVVVVLVTSVGVARAVARLAPLVPGPAAWPWIRVEAFDLVAAGTGLALFYGLARSKPFRKARRGERP